MKRILKENKAITLIALVITIVVLIILAAVAINLTLGNNGIFNRAKTAKEQYQNAEQYEQSEISKTTNKIDNMIDGSRTFDIKDLELDYDNKVNIKSYTSSSNRFTTPSAGIIIATGISKDNYILSLYVNDIRMYLAGWTYSNWDAGSFSQLVTKNVTIYFDIQTTTVLETAYFIPFK